MRNMINRSKSQPLTTEITKYWKKLRVLESPTLKGVIILVIRLVDNLRPLKG